MNGIENIVARIGEDAAREAASITENAQAQAEAVLTDCRAKAEQEAAAIVARGKAQAETKEERLVNTARLEAKKELLGAKQAMVDEAFSRALEQLGKLEQGKLTALLAGLAATASSNGCEQVILSEKDRTACGAQVVEQANTLLKGGKLTLSEESRPMAGGVILKDDKIETNCSFEVLLHLKREELTAQVAGVLFG